MKRRMEGRRREDEGERMNVRARLGDRNCENGERGEERKKKGKREGLIDRETEEDKGVTGGSKDRKNNVEKDTQRKRKWENR